MIKMDEQAKKAAKYFRSEEFRNKVEAKILNIAEYRKLKEKQKRKKKIKKIIDYANTLNW